jgi:hypothetical protein
VKPQPGDGCNLVEYQPESKTPWWITSDPGHFSLYEYSCPFGQPGEVRFVKETWRFCGVDMNRLGRTHANEDVVIEYKDSQKRIIEIGWEEAEYYLKRCNKWRSSSTMPQWASRFNVECTGVVVKQAKDISLIELIYSDISKKVYDETWCWLVTYKKVG